MGQLEEVVEMDSSWTRSLLTAASFTPEPWLLRGLFISCLK